MGRLDYNSNEVPRDYICSVCNATGCKMWRQYQTFCPKLFCVTCAGKDQNKDVSTMNAKGKRVSEHSDSTDQIGWLVPAVPTEDCETYWGYTSVPDDGCNWWSGLPLIGKTLTISAKTSPFFFLPHNSP